MSTRTDTSSNAVVAGSFEGDLRRYLRGLGGLLVFLLVWWVGAVTTQPSYLVPSPLDSVRAFVELFTTSTAIVVPGVGAMMAGGALLPHPLMMRDDQLRVIPGTMDESALRASIDPQRATVIMKVGTNLPLLRDIVRELGLEERAWYVEKASMPEERVMPLVEAPDGKAPYFSMVLIPGPGVRV